MLEIVKSLEGLTTEKRGLKIQEILKQRGFEYEIQSYGILGKGKNIIIDISPENPDKTIIISSHYDVVSPGSMGANDNASGNAVMIEMLNSLWEMGTRNKVRFVFFDGNEKGQKGSKHFVKQNKDNIIGVYNLELVGRGNHFALWPLKGKEEFLSLFVLEEKIKEKGSDSLRLPKIMKYESDHKFFRKKKIDSFTITTLNEKDLELGKQILEVSKSKKIFFKKRKEIEILVKQTPLFQNYNNANDTSDKLDENSIHLLKDILIKTIIELDEHPHFKRD